MATNIPTHNMGEVIDACCKLIDDPGVDLDGLMEVLPGPDFPTGGMIIGRAGILDAYRTGRGSVVMRATHHFEEVRKDRHAIIVTEVPYQVNKARMIEKISELASDKVIEGIAEIRDESDRDGVRVVFELKRDAQADIVLNQLHRHSALQTSFGVNMLAIDQGRPAQMNLREVLVAFLAFRREVIGRRTRFLLEKARARAHVLAGLAIAVAHVDRVIEMIRAAPDPATARERLMAEPWLAGEVAPMIRLIDEVDRPVLPDGTYRLSETQARAILELRLQRLTGLEREKIAAELGEVADEIADHLRVLGDASELTRRLRAELVAIRERFATPRRTRLEAGEFDQEDEDLIPREAMVVTVSHAGYVKRVPLSTYRAQRRGGRGRAGMATREEDFVTRLFVADTHTPLVIFTTAGRAFSLKVWRLPAGTPQSRGRPLINLLPTLQDEERVATVIPLPTDPEEIARSTILFATSLGEVRRNALADFINIKANGKIAMRLEGEDGERLGELVDVAIAGPDHDVVLATRAGQCIRFPIEDLRVFTGRTSTGVRGMRLKSPEDRVISLTVLSTVDATTEEREAYLRLANQRRRAIDETVDLGGDDEEAPVAIALTEERFQRLALAEQFVLTVTARGFGKRTSAYGYRRTGRGGQGIANMDVTGRNGEVVAVFPVADGDELMLVTDGGQVIRIPVADIRITGRKTQGVTLFRVSDEERVVSVSRIVDLAGDDEDAGADDTRPDHGEATA
jgi:DNA gyrase subunit A